MVGARCAFVEHRRNVYRTVHILTPLPIFPSTRATVAGKAGKLSLPEGDLKIARQFTAGFGWVYR